MRINCPLCGERDLREFYFKGTKLACPDSEEWGADWDDYLHNRDNPAGVSQELWQHVAGCGVWLIVMRDTVSHVIGRVAVAKDEVRDAG